jgi:hypothetical protein
MAKSKMWLGCIFSCSFFFVFSAPDASADTTSRLFVYNSAHDVLYGRSQETISFSDLKEHLRQYPSDFKLIGIGLGNNPERLGNYFVSGTTRQPVQYWFDPKSPYPIEASSKIYSSFLVMAVVNPTAVFKRVIKRVPDFLTLLADQMEKFKHVDLAAIRVVGKFKSVKVGVTEMIVSSVEDGPVRVETVFEQPTPHKWEMVGIYARNQSLQLQVSSPGYPIHLHGLEHEAKRGGHIISASAEKVDIYIYPIREYDLYQNDLIITGDRRAGKIRVALSNVGKLEVSQVGIQMEVPGTALSFRKIVPSMRAEQRVEMEFEDTGETALHRVHINVDPDNRISEVREDNNMVKFPPLRRKISKIE